MQPGTYDYTFSELAEIKRFQDEAQRDALCRLAKVARQKTETKAAKHKLRLIDKTISRAINE